MGQDMVQQSQSMAIERRDNYMRGQRYRVLRFWNNEVLGNMDGVCEAILAEIKK